MYKLIVLACLIGAALAGPVAEQEHSLVKRQAFDLEDLLPKDFTSRFNSLSSLNLTTVGIIILLFLVADVIVTLAFAAWLGVGGFGRARQDLGVSSFLGNFYNRIDVVESALDMMSVDEEACRHKAICLAEKAAVSNPFARLAINTINRNLSGLSKYQYAVDAGLAGEDCELIYDECNKPVGFF